MQKHQFLTRLLHDTWTYCPPSWISEGNCLQSTRTVGSRSFLAHAQAPAGTCSWRVVILGDPDAVKDVRANCFCVYYSFFPTGREVGTENRIRRCCSVTQAVRCHYLIIRLVQQTQFALRFQIDSGVHVIIIITNLTERAYLIYTTHQCITSLWKEHFKLSSYLAWRCINNLGIQVTPRHIR